MNQVIFGRLESVELRKYWPNEAEDFTPWLAREENLHILGKALGTELELEMQEKKAGPFRADILCKNKDGARVLIENQLGKTDHVHLGQLLTYASVLEAEIIVWIAKKFTEAHQSALNWLNKATNDQLRFLGLEVQLWRIGNSPPAPRFNIVSKPNDWSRWIARQARSINGEGELSDFQKMQQDYWSTFQENALKVAGGPVSPRETPEIRPYMRYAIGRSGVLLRTRMVQRKKRIAAELYIANKDAELFFKSLRDQRGEIEKEVGFKLTFEEHSDKNNCRIAVYLDDADPKDKNDWDRQHKWLAEKVNKLHGAFVDRIQKLDYDSSSDRIQDFDELDEPTEYLDDPARDLEFFEEEEGWGE